MSERIIHVYRTTAVAEYVVDDVEIYEDDTDMLRDVLEAAKGGLLEFGPTEAEFVAMTWNEDSALTVRAVFPEGSAEAERSTAVEAEYCPRCLEPQFRTAGGVSCSRGHDGLPGIGQIERAEKAEERRGFAPETPAPAPSPKRTTSRRKPRQRNSS